MRDQFQINNYEFQYATKITLDLITLLGFHFPVCTYSQEGEQKRILVNVELLLSQMDWIVFH